MDLSREIGETDEFRLQSEKKTGKLCHNLISFYQSNEMAAAAFFANS